MALCDLVAIGTIADLVPLTGVNRVLTKAGLKQMDGSNNPGISALCRISNIGNGHVSSNAVAFRMAPRINAAAWARTVRRAARIAGSRLRTWWSIAVLPGECGTRSGPKTESR